MDLEGVAAIEGLSTIQNTSEPFNDSIGVIRQRSQV